MELYLLLAAAVLAGLVVALRRIAPLTKNTVDDKALAVAEKAATVAEMLKAKK
jgi:hypothetical protein